MTAAEVRAQIQTWSTHNDTSMCFQTSRKKQRTDFFYRPLNYFLGFALSKDLDVEGFEELFKTKAQGPAVDLTLSRQKLPQKGPSKVSLLEANRAKNLAITLRKAGQGSDIICRAIHTYVQV